MAKPRKKKSSNGRIDHKRKEVESIVNICYQGVRFLGDCHHKPRAMNIQKLWTHLRGPYHEVGMEGFLKTLYDQKEWSVGLMCVFKDLNDPDRFEVASATAIIEELTAHDVSCCISDVILKMIQAIQESDETLTNERFVYYAYFFEPEAPPSLPLKVIGLMDMFMNIGDITEYEPFGDELPGIPSDADTVPLAIKNNGIWPKVREISFVATDAKEVAEALDGI